MAGSKDPFDFDAIYKEAGVDNLFVKKSMAQQKASATASSAARPTPATQPRGPAPAHTLQQAASPGGSMLSSSPGGTGTAGLMGQPLPARPPQPAAGAGAQRPQQPRSGASSQASSSSNLAGLDDPFAGLGGIGKPPPMAASRRVTGRVVLLPLKRTPRQRPPCVYV
jgi:hypothetical protein